MSYQIIRFYREGGQEFVGEVETLEEAQEWCRREDTRSEDWFDGYQEVKN